MKVLLSLLFVTSLFVLLAHLQIGQRHLDLYAVAPRHHEAATRSALTHPAQAPSDLQIRHMAAMGESATGEKMSQSTNKRLILNLKPCKERPDYVSFSQPFTEEPAGEMVCDGQLIKLVAVTKD
ncbi:MAG: hypothetical protein DMF72_02055 [Acidobacteria bacterium]|nr:MAG: hypothetical protein DMF72_02055 [Acidobacteriota bacterium]